MSDAGNDVVVSRSDQDLEHPVGLNFDENCDGPTKEWIFSDNGSIVAEEVLKSQAFQHAVIQVTILHRDEKFAYFLENPNADTAQFTWDLPDSLEFHKDLDRDLYFGFGKVRMDGTIDVTYNAAFERTSLSATAELTDLYDWNYLIDDPNLPVNDQNGARVQAGFPTLGNGGRVYRTKIVLDDEVPIGD